MVNAKISDKELKDFSEEHLYYEIYMLLASSQRLLAKRDDEVVFNALLESFVVHAYNLLDFFYKPQIKPDDAKAAHYIKDFAAWKKVLPAYESYFRHFNKRRNREVTHLTYKRLEVRGDAKAWQVRDTSEKIRKIIGIFLNNADPSLIHPKFNEFKTK